MDHVIVEFQSWYTACCKPLHLPNRETFVAHDHESAVTKFGETVQIDFLLLILGWCRFWWSSGFDLLFVKRNQMHKVDAPIPPIYFEDHELTRKTAHNEKTWGHSFVDLHDAGDVILARLSSTIITHVQNIEISWLFVSGLINAGQVLVDDPLATVERLPHSNIALGMTSHNEIIYLTEAHNLMVFINIWNVWIIEGVLDFGQKVVIALVKLAAFVDYGRVTIHLTVMNLDVVRWNYDIFVLVHELFGAIQFLFV